MGNEAQRAKLYQTVAHYWGEEAAETVMTSLPPWDYTEVARKADVQLAEARLEAKIDGVESRLEAKIDGVESRLEAKIDAQFYRLVAFFLPLMFGVAGLVLAAAALA